MTRLGAGWLIVLAAAVQACGGASVNPACAQAEAAFSRASVPVDLNKKMAELTADERTAVCNEFTRALTDSLGTPEWTCMAASHEPGVAGTATCQASYQDCLQTAPASMTVMYCTDKMSIWDCDITIGQYQACFNDYNAWYRATFVSGPTCAPLNELVCGQPSSAACAAAPCDYVWFD